MKDKNFILTDTLTGTDTITLNTNPPFLKIPIQISMK